MHYEYQIILKRWLPILKEYERTKSKITPRPFKFVKDLCRAHHISSKELRRYYVKWIHGGCEKADPYKEIRRSIRVRRQVTITCNICTAQHLSAVQ
jgi:hypothetical protein